MTETLCKHDGCIEPAVDARGMYAHLCVFHKNQKKHDRAQAAALRRDPEEAPDEEPPANGNGSHLHAAERFLAAARALDLAEREYQAARAAVVG